MIRRYGDSNNCTFVSCIFTRTMSLVRRSMKSGMTPHSDVPSTSLLFSLPSCHLEVEGELLFFSKNRIKVPRYPHSGKEPQFVLGFLHRKALLLASKPWIMDAKDTTRAPMKLLTTPTTRFRDSYLEIHGHHEAVPFNTQTFCEGRLPRRNPIAAGFCEAQLALPLQHDGSFNNHGSQKSSHWNDVYGLAINTVLWVSDTSFVSVRNDDDAIGSNIQYQACFKLERKVFVEEDEYDKPLTVWVAPHAVNNAGVVRVCDWILQQLPEKNASVRLTGTAGLSLRHFPVSPTSIFISTLSLEIHKACLTACQLRTLLTLKPNESLSLLQQLTLHSCSFPTPSATATLCGALQRNQGPNLHLLHCCMFDEQVLQLASSLRGNTTLQTLRLYHPKNTMAPRVVTTLTHALALNQGLVDISLRGITLDDGQWLTVCTLLAKHPTVQTLNLQGCGGGGHGPWGQPHMLLSSRRQWRTRQLAHLVNANVKLQTLYVSLSTECCSDLYAATVAPVVELNRCRPGVASLLNMEYGPRRKILSHSLSTAIKKSNIHLLWWILSQNVDILDVQDNDEGL